jgi:hypothetical protein
MTDSEYLLEFVFTADYVHPYITPRFHLQNLRAVQAAHRPHPAVDQGHFAKWNYFAFD